MDADELEALTAEAYRAAVASAAQGLREAAAVFTPASGNARDNAVLGGAWLVVYKLGQQATDLYRALSCLDEAHQISPTAPRASNLASALLEAVDLDGPLSAGQRAQLHTRATGLLHWALSITPDDDERWLGRATTLAGALLDAVTYRIPDADLDRALAVGEDVVRAANKLTAPSGEPYNILATMLLVAADRGDPRGDLDRAADLLRTSLARTPDDHIDLPARQSNLASVLTDRFERTGAEVDITEASHLHRAAVDALAADDVRRPFAANNLINTLVGHYRLMGDRRDLDEAMKHLPTVLEGLSPNHPMYATARSNAGLLMHETALRADQSDADARADLLAAAAALHTDALSHTAHDDSSWAGRAASLAVTLTSQYQATGDTSLLQQAQQLAATAERIPGPPHERAIFASTLGNIHHEMFLRTGRVRELETAARLHLASLADLPERNPTVPGLLNNAAITLSDRFERLSDAEDLQNALSAIQRSLTLTDDAHPDRPARLNNFALMLLRLFELTGDPQSLTLAAAHARMGADAARRHRDLDTETTCLSTLSDVLATSSRELNDEEAAHALKVLWTDSAALLSHGRSTVQPARTLRQAVLSGNAALRQDLLRQAAESALDSRPSVTLAAARQLAADGLVLQIGGDNAGIELVEVASGLGFAALKRLTSDSDPWRHALSWHREAQGMGALTAQSRLLGGDPAGAVRAFDDGHAALLKGALGTQQSPPDSEPAWTATLWCTQLGGGAVIIDPDGSHHPVMLPGFTTDIVMTWTRRLAAAARLSRQSIDTLLNRQVLPALNRLIAIPMSHAIPAGVPLTWCAGGVAAMLPIAAATAHDREPFFLRHVLRQVPTPSLADVTTAASRQRQMPAARTGWTIAGPLPSRYPPLPATSIEMAAFSEPGRRLVGAAATVDGVRGVLSVADLVHIACHARTTAADPLMSHLLLADDEPLFADEIAKMDCPARIVVLAACDTAGVGSAHADEALGLAGAFLAAGVPGVIASLWSVGDEPTGRFMSRLGAQMCEQDDPVAALHLARIDHRAAGEPLSSWSAFTMLGA